MAGVLIEEARWIGAWLATQSPQSVYPLCNVGSSTEVFRREQQPWIDRHIFAGARAAGHPVVHVDRKEAHGVDLVGDITEPAFAQTLRGAAFRTVLCSNLLEHVTDIDATCEHLLSLVPVGGYLIVTGPQRYPYHLDPIDNGLREEPERLARRFPGTTVSAGATIIDGTYARYMFRSMRHFFTELGEVFSIWRGRRWAAGMRRWAWLHRRYAVTGLVLERSSVAIRSFARS